MQTELKKKKFLLGKQGRRGAPDEKQHSSSDSRSDIAILLLLKKTHQRDFWLFYLDIIFFFSFIS